MNCAFWHFYMRRIKKHERLYIFSLPELEALYFCPNLKSKYYSAREGPVVWTDI
jgi:hypothetical protein